MNEIFKIISGTKEWHNKGYKGQGIKVLVSELEPNNYHANGVKEILKFYAPEVEILTWDYELGKEIDMVDYAIGHKVNIINTSYGSNYPDALENKIKLAYQKAFDHGIIIVKSAGNDGESNIPPKENGTLDSRVIVVGAVDKRLQIESYSSWDNKGTVDCAGLVGLVLNNGTILSGTSEASPYVSGIIACMLSKNKMNLKQILIYLNKYAIDLNNTNKAGVGLVRLPDFENPLAIRMIKPNGDIIYAHKSIVIENLQRGYEF